MKITLDYPVSANRYWRHNQGRIHRSAEAMAYIQSVGWLCATAGIVPLDGDVSVTLRIFRPAKRGDLDNLLKVLLDALQGHAYHNDSQVGMLHAVRLDDKTNPRVEVEISQL
jgi:crossover junction endodeoxyribonuclease RusA